MFRLYVHLIINISLKTTELTTCGRKETGTSFMCGYPAHVSKVAMGEPTSLVSHHPMSYQQSVIGHMSSVDVICPFQFYSFPIINITLGKKAKPRTADVQRACLDLY